MGLRLKINELIGIFPNRSGLKGLNQEQFSSLITNIGVLGLISVQTKTDYFTFQCVADGVADDRANIKLAIDTAIADLPAVVSFGQGDYGISKGTEFKLNQRDPSLTIKGAGKNITFISFNGDTNLNATEFKALDFKLNVTPTIGDYDNYAQYLKITGITFKDNDPFLHQKFTASDSGTDSISVNASFMSDNTQAFIVNGLVGRQLRNNVDKSVCFITSNTATTVTGVMYGGTTNLWNNGDSYDISISTTIEESHAISANYFLETEYDDIGLKDIGDEGINNAHVISANFSKITSINTPSIGFSGAAISIQGGCRAHSFSKLSINCAKKYGEQSLVYNASCIAIAIVTNSDKTEDMELTKCTLTGASLAGLQINTATVDQINDVVITTCIFKNSVNGIIRQGASSTSEGLVFSSNTFSNLITAINFNVNFILNISPELAFNSVRDCTNGFICQTDAGNYSGNNFLRVLTECYDFDSGENNVVVGGTAKDCGDGTTTACVFANSADQNNTISEFIVTGFTGTQSIIRNMRKANSNDLEMTNITAAITSFQIISGAEMANDNILNGGIRLRSGTGRNMNNNTITYTGHGNGDAIETSAGVTNSNIQNNTINTDYAGGSGTFRKGLDILGDNNIVTGNNVITRTAGSGITNTGAGNTLANNHDL